MKQEWIINGSLLLGSILFFFIGGEVFLRVTGLASPTPNPPLIYQNSNDERIGYTLRPRINERAFKATVTTNSLGFRSKEVDGRPLVAVLGDSITFGYGVEDDETLPVRLEERMPQYQFLNTAVPGYQLEQQVAAYEETVRDLEPDAVMLVFFWNDLDHFPPGKVDRLGILRPHDWEESERQCDPINQGILSYLPGKCFLDLHSAFYKAVKKIVSLQESKRTRQRIQEEERTKDTTNFIEAEKLYKYGLQLDKLIPLLPHDAPRIFVIWPDHHLHPFAKPQLKQVARDRGFTVIDLYSIFENKVETLPWDTVHPHPRSLEKAATYITEKVESIL